MMLTKQLIAFLGGCLRPHFVLSNPSNVTYTTAYESAHVDIAISFDHQCVYMSVRACVYKRSSDTSTSEVHKY